MNAFSNGRIVETERSVYHFSSESRAREFLRYARTVGEAAAAGKVAPVAKNKKDHSAACQFLRTH
ncbi:hypothetical protein KTQ42_22025 [Noviherbaspirillum sp. L7-7A]|uniref:hypothetical protein n=1 Tax=Noviherbaspirillum sp. L7-7A TaxID=2850560 RepID=UPI001C2C060D|nr:hypothetical protein [Noviherbaspirillum sp. L7-7A]MBV0881959.1 hypothetical protein [Noviherbaspirillum sp. L7-7A]